MFQIFIQLKANVLGSGSEEIVSGADKYTGLL